MSTLQINKNVLKRIHSHCQWQDYEVSGWSFFSAVAGKLAKSSCFISLLSLVLCLLKYVARPLDKLEFQVKSFSPRPTLFPFNHWPTTWLPVRMVNSCTRRRSTPGGGMYEVCLKRRAPHAKEHAFPSSFHQKEPVSRRKPSIFFQSLEVSRTLCIDGSNFQLGSPS